MLMTLTFVGLLTAMAIGVPIAWTLGIVGLVSLIFMGVPLHTVPQKLFTGMDCFPLMCIPFFILAGEIMAIGGLSTRLLNFALLFVGSLRGGLAMASVIASMIFGGITGSGIADASALGAVGIPMMKKAGYDKTFAAAVVGAAGCIGPIIPPSIPVVVYAMAVGGVSIGGMFAGGLLPGVLIGIFLMILCYVLSRKRNYPRREQNIRAIDFLTGIRDSFLAVMTPIIVLGGILSGIFTPTEAAAVSVVYSFVICYFVYGELKLSALPGMLLRTGVTSAVVMIIIGTSNILGLVIAYEQMSLKLEAILRPMGYYGFIMTVNVIFLIWGCLMDMNPAILILAPIFAPIAIHLGFHPIHFGLIVCINLIIGLITPPLGEILFIVGPIAGISLEELSKEILPFILVEVTALLVITYFPFFTLYVPQLLGYVR
jgi:tripartite ATP-independent transporter DctM subunit